MEMEIVIKIDENIYTRLFDNGIGVSLNDNIEMSNAIRNGTPLPKHHGRLIDADDLYENTEICHSDIDGYACVRWKDINDAPTIIEADKKEVNKKIANAKPSSSLFKELAETMTEEEIQEIVTEAKEKAREQISEIESEDEEC